MLSALEGIRVLDLTRMLAGPFGSMILADLGADVIKIESPGEGDLTRYFPPYFHKGTSAYFLSINRNKKSVVIDLKNEAGLEVFYDLARLSDVVFDNYRPGVLERLKIDHEALKAVNPRIISCSLTGFGSTGPYRDLPAYDLTIQAMGGGMSLTGEPGMPPVRSGIPIGDLAGGLYAAQAIMAALLERERKGKGRQVEVALLDCQAALLTYQAAYYLLSGEVPGPQGTAHLSIVPYQAFKTRDIYIFIACSQDNFFQALCRAIGRPEWIEDPRFRTNADRQANRQALIPMLEEIFASKGGEEWIKLLWEHGVPSGPVNTLDRLFSDPQILSRDMVVSIEDGSGGEVRLQGNPVKFPEEAPAPDIMPPALGEHTEQVLRETLGYGEERIAALRTSGALG